MCEKDLLKICETDYLKIREARRTRKKFRAKLRELVGATKVRSRLARWCSSCSAAVKRQKEQLEEMFCCCFKPQPDVIDNNNQTGRFKFSMRSKTFRFNSSVCLFTC